uniref:Uncharacterized protein n=1 Tax=Arundo donax TaxID=35708 RepID=A0A0A8ZVL8_ARUDO
MLTFGSFAKLQIVRSYNRVPPHFISGPPHSPSLCH